MPLTITSKAAAEHARLLGVAARFPPPAPGATLVHADGASGGGGGGGGAGGGSGGSGGGGGVSHEMRLDRAGRLFIKSRPLP